jgi:hypothetical protein
MSMTLEIVAARVEALELQMAKLIEPQTDAKPSKKAKKTTKKDESDDDKPKKKRTSGYIIFSNATRDDAKTQITQGDEKPKNTDVMKELARQWKALSDEDRAQWNEKAVEIRNAE